MSPDEGECTLKLVTVRERLDRLTTILDVTHDQARQIEGIITGTATLSTPTEKHPDGCFDGIIAALVTQGEDIQELLEAIHSKLG